jgi:hypothetical protein
MQEKQQRKEIITNLINQVDFRNVPYDKDKKSVHPLPESVTRLFLQGLAQVRPGHEGPLYCSEFFRDFFRGFIRLSFEKGDGGSIWKPM